MRWLNWRRAIAVIALIAGVGVGMSATPASADTPNGGGAHTNGPPDWWW
jgi:hypothetical protein